MTNPLDEFDNSEASLVGLPERGDSPAREEFEQVASLFLDRIRREPGLSIEEFLKPYPASIANELREFLPLVGALEIWKAQREYKAVHHSLPDEFAIKQLGEYLIVREIARGGMGVVFEAEQQSLNRRVAVKLLPWQFPKGSSWSAQFIEEARLAASLQHAHIVPVFSFGEHEGRFFYVMQLVEGVGLDKLIDEWKVQKGFVNIDQLILRYHPDDRRTVVNDRTSQRFLVHDSWQQLARIATQIVNALRYAHQQGTLHRDIKPSNLLLDRSGKLWVTDFGLAVAQEKLLNDQQSPLAGTLRYMSPEQLKSGGDARSDIYSFGATLYELCTLEPVFKSKQRQELVSEIERGDFKTPRTLNSAIPVDLESIILKCLQKDMSLRYQTCDELSADLLRFLKGEPVLAKRDWWRRIWGK